MRDIASHGPRLKALGRPKALGNRRSGRAGEPAAGEPAADESVRASESLDDAPHRPPDLYGSLSTLLGITCDRGKFGFTPWPLHKAGGRRKPCKGGPESVSPGAGHRS